MPISHALRLGRPASVLAVVALTLTACGAPDAPTAVSTRPSLSVTSGDTVPGRRLLQCAGGVTSSTTASIGSSGGSLQVTGAQVSMPSGAVDGGTQSFSVATLSGSLVGVDVHAVGETSYRFQQPITVTIDYSRCGTVQGPLRVWYIDPDTHELLEDMGGVNDVWLKTISFTTTHLSIYAVAN
jgi:hypothetical protein